MLKQFKDGIRQALFKCEGLEKENIELELKFKGLVRSNYSRVVSRVPTFNPLRTEESTTVDFFLKDNNRLTEKESGLYDTTKTRSFDKVLEANENIAEDIKLSLSYEKNIKIEDVTVIEYARFRRVKKRTTFFFKDIRLDCTIVDTTKGSNVKTSYEIEIEALNVSADSLISYANESECILTIMSNMFYRINTILFESLIIRKFNRAVDSKIQDRIYTRALSNARDLKKADITLDGLANNDFVVTMKADGVRTILFIDIYGIWKIRTSKDEDIIVKIGDSPNELSSVFPIFLDCEEVFDDSQEEEIYIPFDVIVLKTKEIQKRPLVSDSGNSRFILVKKITGILGKYLQVMTKPYIELGTSTLSLSKAFEDIEEFSKSQEYENDGFIITSKSAPYIVPPNRRYDRNLSNSIEICKLKPWDKLSIDLLYDRQKHKVFVTNNEGKLVEFKGTDKHSFDLDINLDLDDWPKRDLVIEAAPKFVEHEIVLYAYRVRYDKALPNGEFVAKSIWDSLHDHISPNTVLGKDLKLVRMYHNDIKRYVLNLLDDNSPKKRTQKKAIIDIGSGRLGDLMKWSHANIDKVLAIEPSEENINEAYSRLKNFRGTKPEVKIVQAGGEDHEMILLSTDGFIEIDDSISIVSMLSMSFFFTDDVFFERFCNTLRSVATKFERPIWFYFFTVDGTSVRKAFDNKSGVQNFDIVKMEFDASNELLKTNIEGTIVENYTEGLPDIEKLVNHLTPTGNDPFLFYEKLVEPAANNIGIAKYLFNESNVKFNSLYSYGALKIYPY